MIDLKKITEIPIKFLTDASKQWLNFLIDQPTNPPFKFDAAFSNEIPRVIRLAVMVVILSALIIGGGNLLKQDMENFYVVVRAALGMLIGAFLISIAYRPLAYICGIRIIHNDETPHKPLTLRQIIFTVLYTCVPWIPVFAFLRIAVIYAEGFILVLLLFAFWLCSVYILFNFIKAIILVTNSHWYLVTGSVVLPSLLLVAWILFG